MYLYRFDPERKEQDPVTGAVEMTNWGNVVEALELFLEHQPAPVLFTSWSIFTTVHMDNTAPDPNTSRVWDYHPPAA